MKTVHLLAPSGFADWQVARTLAELRRAGGVRVATVALEPGAVTAESGLRVQPDVALERLELAHSALLLVPGADLWLDGERSDVSRVLRQALTVSLPVAAIGSGVVPLAQAGALDDRAHAAADAAELKRLAPRYHGGRRLHPDAAVERDFLVVTAQRWAVDELADAVFAELGLPPPRLTERAAQTR